MKRIIATAVLALAATAVQAHDWTPQEKRWAAAAAAATLVDWAQTRYIAKHPDKYREMNPLLPRHPSLGDVNRHFVRGLIVTGVLAHALPKHRLTILRTTAIFEIAVTTRNAYIGIGLEF